jgi:uncharacterized membrane protein YgcG
LGRLPGWEFTGHNHGYMIHLHRFLPSSGLALLLYSTLHLPLAFAGAESVALPPRPIDAVSDFTGTLNPSELSELNLRAHALEKRTGVQAFAALVDSVGAEGVDAYTNRLFVQWMVGRKGVDNGLLLVIGKLERKVRIETGYGMEGTFPDVVCSKIIRESIVPELHDGRYVAGIQAFYSRVESRLAEPGAQKDGASANPVPPLIEPHLSETPIKILLILAACFSTFFLGVFPWIARAFRRHAPLESEVDPLGRRGANGPREMTFKGWLGGLSRKQMLFGETTWLDYLFFIGVFLMFPLGVTRLESLTQILLLPWVMRLVFVICWRAPKSFLSDIRGSGRRLVRYLFLDPSRLDCAALGYLLALLGRAAIYSEVKPVQISLNQIIKELLTLGFGLLALVASARLLICLIWLWVNSNSSSGTSSTTSGGSSSSGGGGRSGGGGASSGF